MRRGLGFLGAGFVFDRVFYARSFCVMDFFRYRQGSYGERMSESLSIDTEEENGSAGG